MSIKNRFAEESINDKKNKESSERKRWYAVQTVSGYEKRVKLQIEDSIKLEGMQNYFGEILVPSEEVVEMRRGKKRKSERKFFPGYVFIQMNMNEKLWQLVRRTPKVSGFAGGNSEKPTPISDKEVEKIIGLGENSSSSPKPRTTFQVGQVVRVLEGPFLDFTGLVEEINYEKSRLQVSVSILGRSTPVELEFSQVEKDM